MSHQSNTVRNAFSLLEMITVVVVMGILAVIAVPRYAGFNVQQRADAAIRRISADLTLAQRHARYRGTAQRIIFDVPDNSYTLVGMSDMDHPGQAYLVAINEEPYDATIVSANFGGDGELVFNGHGMPDTSGSVVIRIGENQRTLTVDEEMANIRIQAIELE